MTASDQHAVRHVGLLLIVQLALTSLASFYHLSCVEATEGAFKPAWMSGMIVLAPDESS
jgi:hypothetical protein